MLSRSNHRRRITGGLCIIVTLVNGLIYHLAKDTRVRTFRDVVRLPRPNAFVGLDRNGDNWDPNDLPEPKKIYPNLLSVVDSSDPSRSHGDDAVAFDNWVKSAGVKGTIPPEERVFKVSPKVSTIVEFIATDYKMENCELTISIPSFRENSTFVLGDAIEVKVDLWQLEAGFPLDQKTLSWRSKARRLAKLDTLSLRDGMNYSHAFACPMNSIWQFELSLSGADTGGKLLSWKQDHDDPNPSIVMFQHASDRATLPKLSSLKSVPYIETWNTLSNRLIRPFASLISSDPPRAMWRLPANVPLVAQRILGFSAHFHWHAAGWKYQYPSGGHTIHLSEKDGSGVSTHTIAMFHQLRCLEVLRGVYMGTEAEQLVKDYKQRQVRERKGNSTDDSELDIDLPRLTSHCLNYLRQTLLCNMDLRYEAEGSVFTQNGVDAVCSDWQAVYDEAEKAWRDFSLVNRF